MLLLSNKRNVGQQRSLHLQERTTQTKTINWAEGEDHRTQFAVVSQNFTLQSCKSYKWSGPDQHCAPDVIAYIDSADGFMHYHCFTYFILLERILVISTTVVEICIRHKRINISLKEKKIDQNLWLNVKDLIIWADDSNLDEYWFSLSLYAHWWYILIWKLKCTLTNQPNKKKTAIDESKPSCSRRVTLVKERVSKRSSTLAGKKEINRSKEREKCGERTHNGLFKRD